MVTLAQLEGDSKQMSGQELKKLRGKKKPRLLLLLKKEVLMYLISAAILSELLKGDIPKLGVFFTRFQWI